MAGAIAPLAQFAISGAPNLVDRSGGVSPQQAAFAQYTGAEAGIRGAQDFSNIPIGTGQTFATTVGPQFATAYQEARASDADTAARQAEARQQQSAKSSGIGAAGSALGALK